jgi:hypothetical protein
MPHFVSYNTNDSNAGQYTKVALLKGSINESVTELEVEEASGVPAQETFTALIGEELIGVTKGSGAKWTITRKRNGTVAANHSAKDEIFVVSGTGYVPLQAKQELILGPMQTDKAEKIGGSVFSEQTGSIVVQQSFDGGEHWDIATEKSVTAKTAASFEVQVIAPLAQIKFVNGSTLSKEVRIFARTAYQQGR